MARWMRPEEELPGECECDDRLVMIVSEADPRTGKYSGRLVILRAIEEGWDSIDPLYQGYTPEDGVLWAWEKDVVRISLILSAKEPNP